MRALSVNDVIVPPPGSGSAAARRTVTLYGAHPNDVPLPGVLRAARRYPSTSLRGHAWEGVVSRRDAAELHEDRADRARARPSGRLRARAGAHRTALRRDHVR